jgi:hypothetical protein
MKTYIIILSLAFGFVSEGFSQVFFIWPRQKNSTESAAEKENSEINLDKAYEAYNEGNMEKTKYYLDHSERNGWTSDSFYYLLGKWYFDKKKYSAAGKYWTKGYRKRGCWECKELMNEHHLVFNIHTGIGRIKKK